MQQYTHIQFVYCKKKNKLYYATTFIAEKFYDQTPYLLFCILVLSFKFLAVR